MKKKYKFLLVISGFILLTGVVFATVTIANLRKSVQLPWQGTAIGSYDSAHHVGTSYVPESRFTNNGNGTISDNVTGLMWQSDGLTQGTMIRTNAVTYCINLTLGGYINWRLPNIKEMSSISDFTRDSPSIDTSYFTADTGIPYYWSTTEDSSNSSKIWTVYSKNVMIVSVNKTILNYVRCVR